MPQFDVYRTPKGEMVVDCQSDLLATYNSQIVAPLLKLNESLPIMPRLNLCFAIGGKEHVLMIEFLTAIPTASLGAPITSLIAHEHAIKRALDMVVTGF